MEIKLTNSLDNVMSQLSVETTEKFIGATYQLIKYFMELDKILVPEMEYKGDDFEGMDYEFFQLDVIENDILGSLDMDAINYTQEQVDMYFIGRGQNLIRLKTGYQKAISIITMLEDAVDESLGLEEEQMLELRENITESLKYLLYPFLKELDIADSMRQKLYGGQVFHVNKYFNDYLVKRGVDVLTECQRLYDLLNVYPIYLELSEGIPEVWDDFIATIAPEMVGVILDYSEFIRLSDIQKYNQNELEINLEFEEVLIARKQRELFKVSNEDDEGDA